MGSAGVENGAGFLIGAVRVRDGHSAELRGFFRELDRAGQLRGNVRDTEQTFGGIIQAFKRGVVRQAEIACVLRALFLLGEERPFHVDAHEPRTALGRGFFERSGSFVRGFEHVVGQRHGRGGEARDAVRSEILCHFDKTVVVAVGKVRAGIAVVVDIHQTGDHILPVQVDPVSGGIGENFRETPVFHAERAALKAPVKK